MPKSTLYVCGIGASAGGLEALESFFDAMPADAEIAFVVVQHLAPDHKSLMVELLAKRTVMKVVRATHGVKLEANVVYLIPPDANLELDRGKIILTERMDKGGRPNFPIDQFFRSLAVDVGSRSIGIVLSGTGSDGSVGIRSIKAAGGLTLAEDPQSAKFTGMPLAAIDTGDIDQVLTPGAMPAALVRQCRQPNEPIASQPAFERILGSLWEDIGIDFRGYKRDTLTRRIDRRRLLNDFDSLDAYAAMVAESTDERQALCRELMVGVTRFFRDAEAFESLARSLPELIRSATEQGHKSFRVWVAACSTGEEAYSVGALVHEALTSLKSPLQPKIFATDANGTSLERAGRGVFHPSVATEIPPKLLDRYFKRDEAGYEASPRLRESIIFAQHDMLRDPPFTRLDLVTCRNFLIYLTAPAQRRVLDVITYALNGNGLLLLGSSETPGSHATLYEPINERQRLYRLRDPAPKITLDLAATASAPRERVSERQPVMPPSRHPRDIVGAAAEGLLNSVGLHGLVLGEDGDVLFALGRGTELLRVPTGRVSFRSQSWHVSTMLDESLATIVNTLHTKAMAENQSLSSPSVMLDLRGERLEATLTARPITSASGRMLGVGIILDNLHTPDEGDDQVGIEPLVRERIGQLEQELSRARERLSATVEELEASNEELQATNEELVSSNEELQTTNEELQSLNEELHTVNAELQRKVVELSETTDDLENLLQQVDAGILFLDGDMRLRRFNSEISNVLDVLKEDIGRPVTHISTNFRDFELSRAIDSVVATRTGVERQVETKDGRVFTVRAHPIRTEDEAVDGVVLTTHDVTAMARLNRRLELHSRLTDTSPAMHTIADAGGTISSVNKSFCAQTGWESADVVGLSLSSLLAAETTDSCAEQFRAAVEQGKPWSGELWLRTPSGQPLAERAQVFALRSSITGEITNVVKVAERLTRQ